LIQARLIGVDLTKANLSGANLSSAFLQAANLTGKELNLRRVVLVLAQGTPLATLSSGSSNGLLDRERTVVHPRDSREVPQQ